MGDPKTTTIDSFPDDDFMLREDELLLEMVRAMVKHPNAVKIESTRGSETTLLTITVHPDDRGQVIGRERRTLDAMTHILSKAVYRDGRRVLLQLGGKDPVRKSRK